MNRIQSHLFDNFDHVLRHPEATHERPDRISLGLDVGSVVLNNKEKNGIVNNDLHYTQPGYELLGRRYVRQAKALIDGKKPSDNGQPE